MLLYFITCISFFLFLKSLLLKPLPSWATETRLLSLLFCQELSAKPISDLFGNNHHRLWLGFLISQIPARMCRVRWALTSRVENAEDSQEEGSLSVLDLPELALECILEKLPPSALCQMGSVCRSLRERCASDHLWERHMKQKWGRVIGPAAYREWKWHIASKGNVGGLNHGKQGGLMMRLSSLRWPFSWMRSKVGANSNNSSKQRSSLPLDSVMNCYLALESGNFWFPAQVYNRENGHAGFMLSCYDAELSYDSRTDTFQARYPPHGRRADARECGIPWERLRTPPVDSSPHDLHISDCLNDMHPGDHIEIQWRRNREFPYGWWYGVVGHLESCVGNENYCRCHSSDECVQRMSLGTTIKLLPCDLAVTGSNIENNLFESGGKAVYIYLFQTTQDTLVLEFNQYTPGSRWRQTTISRKDHREEGNEADGFYGGIRKVVSEAEVSTWKRLWPIEVLD